jgi:hypothetical protein
VPLQQLTKIVVAQYGNWTEECGFKILANGVLLYELVSGNSFPA